jgi:chromosome condensin MukBEF MukE localization factor
LAVVFIVAASDRPVAAPLAAAGDFDQRSLAESWQSAWRRTRSFGLVWSVVRMFCSSVMSVGAVAASGDQSGMGIDPARTGGHLLQVGGGELAERLTA